MGETPHEIREQIENARSRLARNLNDLEFRVRAETDWQVQFRRRPWVFLAAAFGFAFLLAYRRAR
jgi:hypothetical protein